MAKTKVIAVANQKGGVGKSTTVYNLGAGLAMDVKRVLLDCRPSLGMLVINALSAFDYVLMASRGSGSVDSGRITATKPVPATLCFTIGVTKGSRPQNGKSNYLCIVEEAENGIFNEASLLLDRYIL